MPNETDTPNNPVIPQALIGKLIKLAKRETQWGSEEFCAMDSAGGNFDDAWQGGIDDGESFLAHEILTELGIKF